jgi:hypothetical protein
MNANGLIDPLPSWRGRNILQAMARAPHVSVHDHAALRSEVERATASSSTREELEYLMGDVAAEILLAEVDLRRVERLLRAARGPRVNPRNTEAQVELQMRLEAELTDLRQLAGQIREHLQH